MGLNKIKLKKGQRYKILWKGTFYKVINESIGRYKGEEDNELIFEILGIGDLNFNEQEITQIEETDYSEEPIKPTKEKGWLNKLAKELNKKNSTKK